MSDNKRVTQFDRLSISVEELINIRDSFNILLKQDHIILSGFANVKEAEANMTDFFKKYEDYLK